MNIALVGYGKMGTTIERFAKERGHQISLVIDNHNKEDLNAQALKGTDVVIEFTHPDAALNNVLKCLKAGVPVVCGTTGWNDKLPQAQEVALQADTAFIQSSNFSIGVHLFFEINSALAQIMNHYPDYDVSIEEVHHIHKKDAPSGTAITLAERVLQHLQHKKNWQLAPASNNDLIAIDAKRIDEVPGTHSIFYSSDIDTISLTHTAHNREGFAKGAVVAAEFLVGKKGVFTMKDVLGL